jgi:hypothetical protein
MVDYDLPVKSLNVPVEKQGAGIMCCRKPGPVLGEVFFEQRDKTPGQDTADLASRLGFIFPEEELPEALLRILLQGILHPKVTQRRLWQSAGRGGGLGD